MSNGNNTRETEQQPAINSECDSLTLGYDTRDDCGATFRINYVDYVESDSCNTPANDSSMSQVCGRLATFTNWPSSYVTPTSLAKAGFFYTKISDMVRCFSCNGKIRDWEFGDNAFSEHKRFFPKCEFIQKQNNTAMRSPPGVVVATGMDEVDDSTRFNQSNTLTNNHSKIDMEKVSMNEYFQTNRPTNVRRLQFPVIQSARIVDNTHVFPRQLHPLTRTMYPQFCTIDARRNTFAMWTNPVDTSRIVEAGFFSTGEFDHTQCFYCGGGLRSWSPEDNPWTEHAKWFPKCEWLKREKGKLFIETAQRNQFPSKSNANQNRQLAPNACSQAGHSRLPAVLSTSTFVMKKTTTIVDAMSSRVVRQVLEMGLDEHIIRRVCQHRLTSGEGLFTSTEALFNEVMEEIEPVAKSGLNAASSAKLTNSSSTNEEYDIKIEESLPDKLRNHIQYLRNKTICKICMDTEANIVFLPCSHIVTCLSCSRSMTVCPICKECISQQVRAYMS